MTNSFSPIGQQHSIKTGPSPHEPYMTTNTDVITLFENQQFDTWIQTQSDPSYQEFPAVSIYSPLLSNNDCDFFTPEFDESASSPFEMYSPPMYPSPTVSSPSLLETNDFEELPTRKPIVKKNTASKVLQKRQRNNDSAKRSRERKIQRVDKLEEEVKALKGVNVEMGIKLAVSEQRCNNSRRREDDLLQRIKEYEGQIEKTHQALLMLAH